jgi:hypothetical protein
VLLNKVLKDQEVGVFSDLPKEVADLGYLEEPMQPRKPQQSKKLDVLMRLARGTR